MVNTSFDISSFSCQYERKLADFMTCLLYTSGREGFHWLEEILKLDSGAVVIFITAYADTEKLSLIHI